MSATLVGRSLLMVLTLGAVGCQKLPECNSPHVVARLPELVKTNVEENLSEQWGRVANPYVTAEIVRYFAPSLVEVSDSRATTVDKEVGRVTCDAVAQLSWRMPRDGERVAVLMGKTSETGNLRRELKVLEVFADATVLLEHTMMGGSSVPIRYTVQFSDDPQKTFIDLESELTFREIFRLK